MNIHTIGFTKKNAEKFFNLLQKAQVERIIDVRLNNISQLAGFAKRDDLIFFAKKICNIDYVHIPELAPTKIMLDKYKKHKGSWEVYETEFLNLMEDRKIEDTLTKEIMNNSCLLCSEDKPHHCHRRLVAEYLKNKWNDEIKLIHLT